MQVGARQPGQRLIATGARSASTRSGRALRCRCADSRSTVHLATLLRGLLHAAARSWSSTARRSRDAGELAATIVATRISTRGADAGRRAAPRRAAASPARRPAARARLLTSSAPARRVAASWRRGTAASCRSRARSSTSYGPTEATIDARSSLRPVPPGDRGRPMPIGRPIPNAHAYVLDAASARCRSGVAGELYIGGAGVARGYLDRPELTAERFVPDPFARARRAALPDRRPRALAARTATLEFLGRARSARSRSAASASSRARSRRVLRALPRCREAVVVAREDARAAGGWSPTCARRARAGGVDAARRLRERLPDYMVPAAFVSARGAAAHANGKVDRAGAAGAGWCDRERRDVCGAADDGRRDARRHLGRAAGRRRSGSTTTSSSSAATRCWRRRWSRRPAQRVRRRAAAARRLRGADRARSSRQTSIEAARVRRRRAPPIVPRSRAAERRCRCRLRSSGSGSSISSSPRSAAYNMPVGAAPRGARWTSTVLRADASRADRRHETLRTDFPLADGRPVQVIEPARLECSLPIVRLAGARAGERGKQSSRSVSAEADAPLRSRPRAARCAARLLRLDADEHVLLLTCITSSSTAGRCGVLVRELGPPLRAFLRGRPSPLPELADAVRRLRRLAARWLHRRVTEAAAAPTGSGNSRARRTSGPCRPTGRGPRCRRSAGTLRLRLIAVARRRQAPARAQPARGGDAVHDDAGRISGAACPATRARPTSWSARRSPGATRPRARSR